jgi:hypothetical protein
MSMTLLVATLATPPLFAGAREGEKGAYVLQVGSYRFASQAVRLHGRLKAKGIPAYVVRVQDPTPSTSGTYYRVRVGSFSSARVAREYGQANLAPSGIDFWADLKSRDARSASPAAMPVLAAPPVSEPARAQAGAQAAYAAPATPTPPPVAETLPAPTPAETFTDTVAKPPAEPQPAPPAPSRRGASPFRGNRDVQDW